MESIVKALSECTLRDNNLETFSLVWLDAAIDDILKNIHAQERLRTSINYLKIFQDDQECEHYIRSISAYDRIVLIVVDQLGQKVVPRIHELQQLLSIYVYSIDEEADQHWTKQFTKVRGSMMQLDKLLDQIQANHTRRNYYLVHEPLPISIFNACTSHECSSTSLNGQFVYSQLLIDCLVRMKYTAVNKKELISLLKKEYEGNLSQLFIVYEFEKDYTCNRALWWYTRESFLYKILNKALRVQNIDLLFLFGFFIRDIDLQIKQHQCLSPIRVYRGQLISIEELKRLKNSIGEYISTTSFFSASLNRRLALFYIANTTLSNDFEGVLFDIDADPQLDGVKPFANIKSLSYFCDEEEVLITVGSIFRLIDIRYSEDQGWIIRMKMCSDNDHDLKLTFEHLKNEYGCGETTLLSFGHLIEDMGKFDEAEKYFLRLLNELPPEHKDIAHCYYSLGNVIQEKGDFDLSLEWHRRSLEIKLQKLQSNDASLAESYSSIGCVYDDKGNYEQSLESYGKALSILKQAFGEDHPKVAGCLDSMGLVYTNEKKYCEAIECYEKALVIMQNHLPTNHHQLGLIHTSIGNLYRNLGQYDLALEHYNLSLNICKRSLPHEHPNNAWTLKNIGLLYESMGALQKASSFFEHAAIIYRHALSTTHPDVIQIEQFLQRVSSQING